MNNQSIKILNAIIDNIPLEGDDDERLIIIDRKRSINRIEYGQGAFISFDNLTSKDFFEIYRYKKNLEEIEDSKGR